MGARTFEGKIHGVPRFTYMMVKNAFARLVRWLSFRKDKGWMADLQDIANGEEPP